MSEDPNPANKGHGVGETVIESRESIRVCPSGHPLAAEMDVCPECGTILMAVEAPIGSALPSVPGYELLRELGRGGMGVVYKARQQRLNRFVALKMLLAGEFADLDNRQRFQREAEAVARLQHPNIVQLFEIGEANSRAFFSLEFVEGTNLANRLRGAPLPPRQAAQVVATLAKAIQFAHDQGIIHRDLKPANILLAGNTAAAVDFATLKITDFGLAKLAYQETQHTQTGTVMGTPSYMAPEQALGSGEKIGPATDVYALGAILYELLTGRPPFVAPSTYETMAHVLHSDPVPVRQLQEKVARDLEIICLKCLSKDISKRYASARELADDLQRFLDDQPIIARPASGAERIVKWARRRPATAALWIGAFAIVIGSIAAGILYDRQLHDTRARTQAAALVRNLREVETSAVPQIVADLADLRPWADPMLQNMLRAATPRTREKLHASLALFPVDPAQADYLVLQIPIADFQALSAIRTILRPDAERISDRLWKELQDPERNGEAQLRIACVLADYSPTDPRWNKIAPTLVGPLLTAVGQNPANFAPLAKGLTPVKDRLLDHLKATFRNERGEDFERFMAAHILADYLADNPAALAELLMDANNKQFPLLFKALKDHGNQVNVVRGLDALSRELDLRPPDKCLDDVRETLAKRQANAGAALMSVKMPEKVWPLLKLTPDPRVRSYLIHRIGPLGGDLKTIVDRLDDETDLTIRRALILSLGRFDEKDVTPGIRRRLLPKLKDLYTTSGDPGIHSATEWLLRCWKETDWLKKTNEHWADDTALREKRLESIQQSINTHTASPEWYVTSQGQTMVVIPGPVQFQMGSPETEVGRFEPEAIHPMRIDRSFAVAAKAVTVEEFRRFNKSHKFTKRYAPEPDCPVITISWFNATAYCNWLSEQDGIPKDQWCYETDDKGQVVRMNEGYLRCTGYRLPTEAELEYATRAGTTTSRYYGETDELLTHYGWYIANCEDHSWPVGLKMPNDFGLFDVYGNVWNWCQETAVKVNRPVEDKEGALDINPQENRVIRGGSFVVRPWNMRSANFDWNVPTHQNIFYGFRVARTVAP